VAALGLIAGVTAAMHYSWSGLTLSHYDARGHLVVARRIADSITPGWQQVGAVWLPLPHVLNALPVQIDWMYRTGASAVALSVVAHVLALTSIALLVFRLTRSTPAAIAAAAVFGLNPNVLYLQSTPMTEPLLLGMTLAGVAALTMPVPSPVEVQRIGGILLALACLTRFEAWLVTSAAITAAAWTWWRQGTGTPRDLGRIALPPLCAVLGFMLLSRAVVGRWFVADGFFVPDPKYATAWLAAGAIWEGLQSLSDRLTLLVGGLGLLVLAVRGVTVRSRAHELVPLALVAAGGLPWAAFLQGHPFRVRYMVSLIAAEAVGVGIAVGLFGTRAFAAVLAGVAVIAIQPHPLQPDAPVVVEAQWDRPGARARSVVTACLQERYRGETIMASMGSLGHYMQELAAIDLDVRDFLHEGNGDIWLAAIERPQPYVGWLLLDERSEGGDLLAHAARVTPGFLEGFTRVCDGGGVALYRRAVDGREGRAARRSSEPPGPSPGIVER